MDPALGFMAETIVGKLFFMQINTENKVQRLNIL